MVLGQAGMYVFLFLALYFEVFLMISFFEKRPARKTAMRPARYPTVDIIVPCFNEERTLAGTVKSILALDYPKKKLGIIIVDDGSTDGTLKIAERFRKNPQVRVIHKENGGKYTALNLGIENSTAHLVGCLDADSFVVEDALIETVKVFEERREIMAVVPAMKVHNPRNLLELMQAVEYTFGIFYKKMFDNLSAISVLPGPFSFYRREIFATIGPFRRAHNTEDMEMAFRMHHFGLAITNAHTAVVYTKVPRTIRTLLKQRTRWSQGFLQNCMDYKHALFNPRFGHFGFLVLPLGLITFVSAIYSWAYLLVRWGNSAVAHAADMYATQIPLRVPQIGSMDWFYINTSTLSFLILAVLILTITAIFLGKRMVGGDFGIGSLVSYFALYGILAPLWLAQAVWGAARSRESEWRSDSHPRY